MLHRAIASSDSYGTNLAIAKLFLDLYHGAPRTIVARVFMRVFFALFVLCAAVPMSALAVPVGLFEGGYVGMRVGYMAELRDAAIDFTAEPTTEFVEGISLGDEAGTGASIASLQYGFAHHSGAQIECEFQYYYDYSDLKAYNELELSADVLSLFIDVGVYYASRELWGQPYIPLGVYASGGVGVLYTHDVRARYVGLDPNDVNKIVEINYGGGESSVLGAKARLGVTFDMADGVQFAFGCMWLWADKVEVLFAKPDASVRLDLSGLALEIGGRAFL